MAAVQSNKVLTDADISHFLDHGYVKLSSCFSKSQVEELTVSVWTRLGISDPQDKSQWDEVLATNPNAAGGRINMPFHKLFPVKDFAPEAWKAIGDLLAPGQDPNVTAEDVTTSSTRTWSDGLIMNLGTKDCQPIPPHKLTGWHTDGDFFIHYLDSPEQALLVIPLYSDIRPGGGATMICPPAIKHIAHYLRDHPEGVTPLMTPRAENPEFDPRAEKHGLKFFNDLAQKMYDEHGSGAFIEATGSVGDVYLLHPFMLHSASENWRRDIRIITNPAVAVKEPFNLDRARLEEYSIVELATLRALGVEEQGGLRGWRITAERGQVIPERIRKQKEAKEDEERRLARGQPAANS